MRAKTITHVTQAAYAKRVGLSQSRVAQLIREGLPTNGSRIDPIAADRWVAEHSDPVRKAAARGKSGGVSGGSVAAARAAKLQADVRLSQLKLGERDGSLVERASVGKFIFERARFERDRWVGWIARSAPELAAALDCDPHATFSALDRVVRDHLVELAMSPLDTRIDAQDIAMMYERLKSELRKAFDGGMKRQLTLATVGDLGGFRGKPSNCHGNVDNWIKLHPHHRAVRGWLQTSTCTFNKHSVVETDLGVLLDITHRESGRECLTFVEHKNISDIPYDEILINQIVTC